jgi:outer membrane immunogenic protein
MRPIFMAVVTASACIGIMHGAAAAVKTPPARAALLNWTGCYAGVNVGGGWGEHTGDRGIINSGNATLNAGVGVPTTLNIGPSGAIGGGQVGCNYKASQILFGVEADIQGSGVRADSAIFFPSPNGGITDATNAAGEERIDWFGTVRGRLGFIPTSNLLIYATGGLAYGGVDTSASLVLTPASDGNYSGRASETRAGWAVGAGGEYLFTPNWSVKLEYLYLDFGMTNVRMLDPGRPGTFIDYSFHHRDNVFRVGLNYKFN